MGSTIVDWTPEMAIGLGFDFLRSQVKGCPADPSFNGQVTRQPSESQSYEAHVTQIENTYDFNSTMEVGTDVSIGYGVYSASASFNYSKSKTIHKYSLYYLVTAGVKNNSTTLNPGVYKLTTEAKQFNKDTFISKFGDYYISGFVGGGSFTGLIEVHTESDSEKTKIEQQFKASGAVGGVQIGLSQKFANEVNTINQTNRVTISLNQVGGDSTSIPLATMDEIMKRAQELPSQISKNPFPIKAIITPYNNLPDYNLGNSDYSIPFVEDQKKALSQAYLNGKYYRDCLLYAQANPGQFDMTPDALNTLLNSLNAYLSAVYAERIKLDSNPTTATTLPPLPDVSKIPPRIGDPKAVFSPPSVRLVTYYEEVARLKFRSGSAFDNDASAFIVNYANQVSSLWSYISSFSATVVDYLQYLISGSKTDILDILSDLSKSMDTYSTNANNTTLDLTQRFTNLKNRYKETNLNELNTIANALEAMFTGAADDSNIAAGGKSFFANIKENIADTKARVTTAPANQKFTDIVEVNESLWRDLKTSTDTARLKMGGIA